eukprot:COSAG01_NODE_3246_length_6357_cov_4.131831_3_plen_71_part_00
MDLCGVASLTLEMCGGGVTQALQLRVVELEKQLAMKGAEAERAAMQARIAVRTGARTASSLSTDGCTLCT